jgi:hypothetical protein
VLFVPVLAARASGTDTALDAKIRERFAALMPDVQIQAIETSPLQGSRQVITNLGLFCIGEDLHRLVQGTAYVIETLANMADEMPLQPRTKITA